MIQNKSNWKQEEEEYLKRNYHKKSIKELAAHLRRGTSAVYKRCYKLGLTKKENRKVYKPWTEAEKKQLSEIYPHMRNKKISQLLNRTEYSITAMAKRMGLKKKGRR